MEVIISGSNNAFDFAVTDFTAPNSPTNVTTNPGLGGGCMVDASGTLAAVGNFNGSQVTVFDISNPAIPVAGGSVGTLLSGIGAISVDAKRVLIGELNSGRAVLIDASNPANPTVISTHNTTLGGISAIALSGGKAVAAGPNDLAFVVIDYSNPATPTHARFNGGTNGVFFNGSMTADIDGSRAAVADAGSGDVHFFDVSGATPNRLGVKTTTQAGVTSVSISGTTVAAASSNNIAISLVSFANPANPTETDLGATGLNGGATVKLAGNRLAAGDVLGTEVALFAVAGTVATPLGVKANTTLPSIATIAFSTFVGQAPAPKVAANPTSLAFGAVHVGTPSTLPLDIKNNGNATLHVSALHSTTAQYVANTAAFTVAAGGSHTLQVTFTPTASQPFSASLVMTTDDPNHLSFSVGLGGSGGLPLMVLPSGTVDLGNVAVCLSHIANVPIGNAGPVPLKLSQIAASGAPFSEGAGSSLTVAANATGNIPVTYAPTATGAAAGSLSLHSDDPTQPTASVALKGTGTPEPPPHIGVTPGAINFQAVPVQYFIGIAVTVSNTGPCETLSVNLAASGGAFLVTTGNPTTLPMGNPGIADSIAPNTSKQYTAVFAPTALGATSGSLTITHNAPSQAPITLALSGTGVAVAPAAIELVLDRSGSMATPITGGTRMDALHSAVSMFADLVIPLTGFAMGSVQFDDAFAVLTPLANFDAMQQAQIKNDANTLTPRNLTSIGGGLQLGQTQLAGSSLARKVAIVFTDGWENSPPMVAAVEPAVLNAGTEVYAVGLGDPTMLSVAVLSELANSSNGKFFQTPDPLVLRKQFVEVLADAFRMSMAADPIMALQQGVPVSVPVDITNCEARISFVLLWEDLSAQIQLAIRAPDGTTFTSSAGTTNRLVRYVQRPGYRFFQIALPPGPSGSIGPKQLGQWQMLIDPVSLPSGATRASTSVMVDSALQMTALVSAPSVIDPLVLHVRITDHGTTVSDAQVKVAITAPIQSLSQLSTPIVHQRALLADKHLVPLALQHLTKTHTTQFEAKFNEREFLLHLPPPGLDGVYHAEVTATGKACGGVFQRYWSSSFYVGRQRKPPLVGTRSAAVRPVRRN